jgi:hypothetical protein
MPTVQDIANQINARLDAINQNTSITAQNTTAILGVTQDIRSQVQEVNSRLAGIRDDLQLGFANLSQGLFAIAELQRAANVLLDHHRRQNDTIICELTNAGVLLCGITRKLTQQLEMSAVMLTSVKRLEGIAEREQAAAAADYDRLRALKQSVEACCPPLGEPVEPCPEPCDRPDFRPHRPEGQGWQPLPTPQRPVPVG